MSCSLNLITKEMVQEYTPLVRRIAYHLLSKLPPSVMVDDLIQDGMEGLLKACGKYDSSQGASFKTYAGIRIHGSMLDGLRKNDIHPKKIRRLSREVNNAALKVQNKKLRPPTKKETATEMGVPIKEFHKILNGIQQCTMISIEDPQLINREGLSILDYYEDKSFNTEITAEIEQFVELLSEFIELLPKKEQTIFVLYYIQGLSLREVGLIFNVSESRISQLLQEMKMKIRYINLKYHYLKK